MAVPCTPTGDKQVQLRRGTTAENDAFIGADGELSFDTDQNRPRVHDGATLGGFPIALLSDIVPGSSPPFIDTTNLVMGSVDNTKQLRLEVDGFTAATTRVLTPQNADYILAGTNITNTFSISQIITPAADTPALALNGLSVTGAGSSYFLGIFGDWNTTGSPAAIDVDISNLANGAASKVAWFKLSNLISAALVRPGLQLENPALAFSGVQQFSPSLNLVGQGWKTTATAASQPVEYRMYVQPIQGTTNPTANLLIDFSVNAGAFANRLALSSVGTLSISGALNVNGGNVVITAGSAFSWSTRARLSSSADGVIELFNSTATGFTRLNFGGTTTAFPAITRSGAAFIFNLGDGTGSAAFTSGNHTMTTAALLSITSGTNQRAGNAVLVAGTVTVANTTVTANTIVLLTRKTSGGTPGTLITYTVTAATSFTINSDSALDTSTFSYFLIEVP